MGSVVSRKCVSEAPLSTCFSSHGFPAFQFQVVFVSLISTCSLLHPSSFVLLSLHFSFLLCLASCLHFCLAPVSVSLFPLLIPLSLSSRQIAGLGVMVRCLGRLMVYTVVYTAKERKSLSFFLQTPLSVLLQSLHFPKHVLSLPDVHTQS